MTKEIIVTCGSCSKNIKMIVGGEKPTSNYYQCPSCGKNLVAEGYKIEDYVKENATVIQEPENDLNRLLNKLKGLIEDLEADK